VKTVTGGSSHSRRRLLRKIFFPRRAGAGGGKVKLSSLAFVPSDAMLGARAHPYCPMAMRDVCVVVGQITLRPAFLQNVNIRSGDFSTFTAPSSLPQSTLSSLGDPSLLCSEMSAISPPSQQQQRGRQGGGEDARRRSFDDS